MSGVPVTWSSERARGWLRVPGPRDDKYRRGVLGMRTGSARYPGAAVLGVTAAWRTGVGLLRYAPPREERLPPHGLPSPAAAVLAARPETVIGAGTDGCAAWVIGSGTDPAERGEAERAALVELLGSGSPIVVDAGALDLVAPGAERGADAARDGSLGAGGALRGPAIVTPHAGEFARMWDTTFGSPLPEAWPGRDAPAAEPGSAREAEAETARAEAALRLAARIGATVLLKGSRTLLASPGGTLLACGPATPWLATAGTGDVLAGILGALLAAHADAVREDPELLAPIGATAALLHDAAARRASGCPEDGSAAEGTTAGRPVTALDVAEAIPHACAALAGTAETDPAARAAGKP
ncbi:ADP-dependent NAD(P)H-hydrate dehydratase [Leucobacter massiliensis]|uniref:ADP-dependent (S)-NAD(P)H-hydrate dehydratase n=1 Tax=Leucobacter massiliensis TaxID=1686285 RepID=A0A2S9QNC2_9MICO|nr:ADP/ATP-dependent (S)-NAD(P)H-hydrate dehydratase [Leucobacter massiliensis]PRI11094.1 hypothetical protein B4915_09550 [Leucobacter massiliensis]